MTSEQLNKAKEIAKNIDELSRCIIELKTEDRRFYHLSDYLFKNACFIVKDEVISVFDNKIEALKTELAEL